jgi:antitoxin FitA
MTTEVITMEHIVIRNLPQGTKAALRARAGAHRRSVEAEARKILIDALSREPASLVDLLNTDGGEDIGFEPLALGSTGRIAEL